MPPSRALPGGFGPTGLGRTELASSLLAADQALPGLGLGPAPVRCFQYGSSDNICRPGPYAPNDHFINSTYYGQLYLNPHVVKPGQEITGTAVTRLGSKVNWSAPPGPVVAGCQGQDPNCTWKAPGVTGGWSQWQIGFTGFFGTGASADYYAVDQKTVISGTFSDTDGEPIAGATIRVSGPTSGTVATDEAGFYSAVVEAGEYSVSAMATEDGVGVTGHASYCAPGGEADGSCSLSVGDSDGTADFTAGQEVTGTIADDAAPQADLTVDLSGTGDKGQKVALSTTTNSTGQYTFTPPPGTYTVAPQVPSAASAIADGFVAKTCPGGAAQDGTCEDLHVRPDTTDNVNFQFGCGVEGVEVDKVQPVVENHFGAVPYGTVMLLGKGFCPNMKVYFGNPLALTVVDTTKSPDEVTKDGTVATVPVARLATTGTVVVGSGGQLAELHQVPIDSFRNVYGFSFDNFDGVLTPAEFAHVFPSATVTAGFDVCPAASCNVHIAALTPQALLVYLQDAIDFGGGDCFGFSLGAARLAPGGDLDGDLAELQPGAGETSAINDGYTGNPLAPGPVRDFLNQLQLAQYSVQVEGDETQAALINEHQTGAGIVSEITSAIDNDPATTGKYNDGAIIALDHRYVVQKPTPHYEWEGHAVLAYNVETDRSSPWAVDVYDPNVPFDPVENSDPNLHRTNANESRIWIYPNGTWTDSQLGWSGASSTISVLSVDQIEEQISAGLTFSNPPASVNASPDPGTIILAITAPDGHAVDLAQGGDQGVKVIPALTGTASPADYGFSGPLGMYQQVLTSTGPIGETLQTNGFQVTVNASPGTDDVVFDTATDTLSVGPAPTGTPSKTASVTIDQNGANGSVQYATVTGSPIAGALSLEYTSFGQAWVAAPAHRAANVTLTLADLDVGQVPRTFSTSLALRAGNTAIVSAPSWSTYTGAPVTGTVGPSGKVPKDVTLANDARPAPEPRVVRVRVGDRHLLVSLSLPALPSGSSASLVTTFLSARATVERKTTTTLAHLGHASNRSLEVLIPAHAPAGTTAWATLVAVTTSGSGLVTSSAHVAVPPGL
jgi:hypothetical protein